MENGLHRAATEICSNAPLAFAGGLYNTLCLIQENYWSRSIPPLKNDLSDYRNIVDRFKLSKGKPLLDEKFLS